MAEEFDLALRTGRVHVQRVGPVGAPLTLLVHGLSAHMRAFDYLIEGLATSKHQLVALDLRGRGRSEITAAGTYGLDAHCRDVLEVATLLGADEFDLIGWSMGALIAIGVANRAPQRLRRVVLIDHAGPMDAGALNKVESGLGRLDAVVQKPVDYVNAIRAASGISPWNDFWERYYRYELGPHNDGYRPTTSKAACQEDVKDVLRHNWVELWKGLTMPALLVRCNAPIGGGFIVPETARDDLRRIARQIEVAEVSSDHFTVMHDERTLSVIKEFLSR